MQYNNFYKYIYIYIYIYIYLPAESVCVGNRRFLVGTHSPTCLLP
jgi:hypothetical protein